MLVLLTIKELFSTFFVMGEKLFFAPPPLPDCVGAHKSLNALLLSRLRPTKLGRVGKSGLHLGYVRKRKHLKASEIKEVVFYH